MKIFITIACNSMHLCVNKCQSLFYNGSNVLFVVFYQTVLSQVKAPEVNEETGGGTCQSCLLPVTEMIRDLVRFMEPVLSHCISCGVVTCRECLRNEIRDGRVTWPVVRHVLHSFR